MAGHGYTSLKSVNDPFQGPSKYQVCHLVAHKRSSFQPKGKSAVGHVHGKLKDTEKTGWLHSPKGQSCHKLPCTWYTQELYCEERPLNQHSGCWWEQEIIQMCKAAAADKSTMRIRLEEKCSIRAPQKEGASLCKQRVRLAEQHVPLHPVQVSGSHLCSSLKGNHRAESQS